MIRELRKMPFGLWIGLVVIALAILSCSSGGSLSPASPPENFSSRPPANMSDTNNLPIPTNEESASKQITTEVQSPETTPVQVGNGAQEQQDAIDITPQELAPYITWGGWGAGGLSPEFCLAGKTGMYFNKSTGSANPPLAENGDDIARGQIISVNGCNYPVNETIQVTFILPNGFIDQSEIVADLNGDWEVAWLSMPDEPLGLYTVQAISNSGSASLLFTVHQPTAPVLKTMCFADRKMIILTGFMPNEQVLLGWYDLLDDLTGRINETKLIIVDENGSAQLMIPQQYTSKTLYEAVGTLSPRELVFTDEQHPISAFDFSCDLLWQ